MTPCCLTALRRAAALLSEARERGDLGPSSFSGLVEDLEKKVLHISSDSGVAERIVSVLLLESQLEYSHSQQEPTRA